MAIDRIEPLKSTVFRALAAPRAGVAVVPHLVSAIALMDGPVTLVIDHAEVITSRESLDVITELALSIPAGSRFVLASRDNLQLPTARLRAQGGVVEIGAADLAMGADEAADLLAEAGVELDADEVGSLVARTEGWPAGLYLAALAMKAGSPRAEAAVAFTGDDRYVDDYLRAEFLDRVSRAEVSFLTRTSILERMSGPLCDAVVGRRGSGRALEQLERRNLLVIPLDRRREWYRYHQLFRELLHAELRRREPEMIPELERRAATWCEANGLPEAAIDHAQAAGDGDRVARLVLNIMQPVWASGRVDTVLRWMEWLEGKPTTDFYGAIAVHGSLIYALLGRPGEAERWATAAERASAPSQDLPDGNTMEATLAYMRSLSCRNGLDEMRHDAEIALAGFSPATPYRATMLHTQAVGYLLEGDLDRAEPMLARAMDVASGAGALPLVPFVLAWRGAVAIERDDWPCAEAFAEQALAIMHGGQFDHYWTAALVYAWTARVAVHLGDVNQARSHVAKAAALRPCSRTPSRSVRRTRSSSWRAPT